jgi:hypothetical protein
MGMDVKEVIRSDPAVATVLAGRPILLFGGFGGDGAFPVFGEPEHGELARATSEFLGPDDETA